MKEMENYEVIETSKPEDEGLFVLDVQTKSTLITNRTQFFEALGKSLEQYKGIVLTEETLKEGKKTVADLRKKKDAINRRRIEIKKDLLKPYEQIETFCKEVDQQLDAVITPLAEQLQIYEQERIRKKIEDCENIIRNTINPLEEKQAKFINSCLFLRKNEWQNTNYSISKVTKDVQETVGKILNDLDVLKTTLTDKMVTVQALEVYKQTGDVARTIQCYHEVESRNSTNMAVLNEETKPSVAEIKNEPQGIENSPTDNEGEVKTYQFTVNMTKAQLSIFVTYLKEKGISGTVKEIK